MDRISGIYEKMERSPLLLFACVNIIFALHDHGHPLHKRQLGPCLDIAVRELCTGGTYQDWATLALRCNDSEMAHSLQDGCSINSMGRFCLEPDLTHISDRCGISPTTCSPECRDLLTTTRAELGCCVKVLNRSSNVPPHFLYSLWSLCSMEPVTEDCTSPITLPQTEIDPTCTESVYRERFFSEVVCKRSNVEPVRAKIAAEGCEDRSQGVCSVNAAGQYCGIISPNIALFQEASENCRDTTVCEPICMQTLSSITVTDGCCFTDEYNHTASQEPARVDWLSNEFWSRCGVTPPGICQERISGQAFIHTVAAGRILSFLAVLLTIVALA